MFLFGKEGVDVIHKWVVNRLIYQNCSFNWTKTLQIQTCQYCFFSHTLAQKEDLEFIIYQE